MAARIARFTSKADLLKREQAVPLRQMVLALEPEVPVAVRQILAVIDRHTAASKGWSFVMLSPAQNRLVVRWINENSRRKTVASELWAEFFCHLLTETGEVIMDRQAMMKASGGTSPQVSEVLAEFMSIKAIIRHQEGRTIRWFMNPNVGTHLAGAAREEAQRSAPSLLTVMQGGKL